MDEKKAKELTDSIFDKLNDQERVYLAWVHNQKNKEIKRLNNIIKEIRNQLNYLETYSSKEDIFEDMKRRLNNIDNILKDSDKE